MHFQQFFKSKGIYVTRQLEQLAIWSWLYTFGSLYAFCAYDLFGYVGRTVCVSCPSKPLTRVNLSKNVAIRQMSAKLIIVPLLVQFTSISPRLTRSWRAIKVMKCSSASLTQIEFTENLLKYVKYDLIKHLIAKKKLIKYFSTTFKKIMLIFKTTTFQR